MNDSNKLPVFLCYRQVDGGRVATWLFDNLQGKAVTDLPQSPQIDLYFDRVAPAVGNWVDVHGKSLERSRALIFICTPGARSPMGKEDWVHRELEWWIANRKASPIIIDTTHEGDRWIPDCVNVRWPHCQRVCCNPDEWRAGEVDDRANLILKQIVDGIRLSDSQSLFQDVEKARNVVARSRSFLVLSLAYALSACLGVIFLFYINRQIGESNDRLRLSDDTLKEATVRLKYIEERSREMEEKSEALRRDTDSLKRISVNLTHLMEKITEKIAP